MLKAGFPPLDSIGPHIPVVASFTVMPTIQRFAGFVVPCEGGYQDKKLLPEQAHIALFEGTGQMIVGTKAEPHGRDTQVLNPRFTTGPVNDEGD